MLNNDDIYNNISLIYQKKRQNAEDIRNRRLAEVYQKLPRIAEIDEELKKASLHLARLALSSEDKDKRNKSLSEYNNKITALITEKERILIENKYPIDYFKPPYSCPICGDTGSSGTKKCECFQKTVDAYISEQHYKLSGVKDILYKENFDTLDLSLFSKKKPEDKELSPYDNMVKIVDSVKKSAAQTDRSNPCNLIFSGKTGVGKTFLCNCTAKALLDKGLSLHYVSAFKLFKDVSDGYFGKHNPNFDMDTVLQSDVLVIDDLGAEVRNSVTKACFLDIINQRVRNGGSTLITTNFTIRQLFENYDERIGSRFAQYYKLHNLYGDDIRML